MKKKTAKSELLGKIFGHPHLGVSFYVSNIGDGVVTMTRNEVLLIEDLKKWKLEPDLFENIVAISEKKLRKIIEQSSKHHETTIGDMLRKVKK